MNGWTVMGLGLLFLASLWWGDLTRKRKGQDSGDSGFFGGDFDSDGGCD